VPQGQLYLIEVLVELWRDLATLRLNVGGFGDRQKMLLRLASPYDYYFAVPGMINSSTFCFRLVSIFSLSNRNFVFIEPVKIRSNKKNA
jgi:hypothetical protein